MRKEKSCRAHFQAQATKSVQFARATVAGHSGVLEAYDRLRHVVQSRTRLLSAPCRLGAGSSVSMHDALLALALHHADWLRPIERWLPPALANWPVLTSLCHHLFARYPVPAFMTSVWLEKPAAELRPEQDWFKHLGLGRNIRTAALPLRLTRAMAHWFGQAPHHLSARTALRWAQVRGLGGSAALAQAILATRLGAEFENDDFWQSVLHFFINQPSFDLSQASVVIDFIHQQKFAWREGITSDGVFGWLPPPFPDYSIKGRTVASILRQLRDKRRMIERINRRQALTWRPAALQPMRFMEGTEAEGDMRIWTITELCTGRELFLESQAMRHCVYMYLDDCVRRRSSIWSLKVENKNGRRRVLTIEVDPGKRRICQVRGRSNRLAQPHECQLIERWAAQEGISMAD